MQLAGLLRPGRPDDKITMSCRVDFKPAATCPRWELFLREVFLNDDQTHDDDLIDFVHRAAGYSITGLTSEQLFFICYGGGANGKSVFLNTIRAVLGDYGYNTAFSTFELFKRAAISNDLAALDKRRFITASETTEGSRLNEARLKAFVHGDPITARYLFHEEFTFQPHGKVWLAVNSLPRVADLSKGFWRSVACIPFRATFEGDHDDRHLKDKLLSEAEGILNWLVRGCLAWQQKGLRPLPAAVQVATAEYEADQDNLTDFITDRCILSDDASIRATEAYAAYADWAKSANLPKHEVYSTRAFGLRLTKRFQKEHRRDGKHYLGLRQRMSTDA